MIRIDLPSEQREMLEKARRIRTPNLAERCLAVLLSDRGQSVPVIAESIGRHDHTIRSWLKAYLQDGIEGLRPTPPPGRTNRKEQEAVMILQPVLAKHPSEYGYLAGGWSTHLLVDYPYSVTCDTGYQFKLSRGYFTYLFTPFSVAKRDL